MSQNWCQVARESSLGEFSWDKYRIRGLPRLKDPSIPKLLNKCIQKSGAKPGWKSLLRYARDLVAERKPLRLSEPCPEASIHYIGYYVEQKENCILYRALTLDMRDHVFHHSANIYPDGRLDGEINCFGLGVIPMTDTLYVEQHLKDLLKRLMHVKMPCWDVVDGVAVEK